MSSETARRAQMEALDEIVRAEADKDFYIYVKLPFSDLEPQIPDEEFYPDFEDSFPFSRLYNIRQLSFITEIGEHPETVYRKGFPQDRGVHSHLVTHTARRILEYNDIPKPVITLTMTATQSHDIGTPAGGDAVKKVDPLNLDEETHWQNVLDDRATAFFDKYNISPDEVDDIIKNKGLLGQVLDIADKIAYVMMDIYNFTPLNLADTYAVRKELHQQYPDLYHDKPKVPVLRYDLTEDEKALFQLLMLNPKLGNIYQDVTVDPDADNVYFRSASRLGAFLTARAMTHKTLYYHPINQGRDMFIADLVRPYYSTNPEDEAADLLTPDSLRDMNDQDLFRYLGKRYNCDINQALFGWYPEYIKVNDQQEALSAKEGLAEQGKHIIGIKEIKGFKTGTNFNVLDSKGEVRPYREAYPERAEEIDAIERSTHGTFVLYSTPGRANPHIDGILDWITHQS